MALVTQADIEEYSGFRYSDFTENGQEMTQAQWASFIASLIPKVTQMIHRYCNVASFEPISFTEYHNGKGATNFDSNVSDYDDEDMTFFLRQLYVGDGSLVVQEDAGSKTGVPVWTSRSERPNIALPEIDAIVITNGCTTSGNVTIRINNDTNYNVAVTAGWSISQVCDAIIAAGAHNDGAGDSWTPSGQSPYVNLTCGVTGAKSAAQFTAGTTGVVGTVYVTQKGTAAAGGDYEVMSENDVTRIMFHLNVPLKGNHNLRFTYNTGYPVNSAQLNDIKFQCLRACNNVLLTKKKIQEANTIRNFGVRDYSQMFDVFSEALVIDDKVRAGLDQYKRMIVPGQWCYD